MSQLSQLGLFFNELSQAQNDAFPCEYVENFISQQEADAFFRRFVNWNFCKRHNPRNRKQVIRRQGITFVSDINHPQVTATFIRRMKQPTIVEEDGCVGKVVEFDSTTPDEVKRLRDQLSAKADRDINYVGVQIYPDGAIGIDWHRHSEDDGLGIPTLIVSVGEEREFHVGLQKSTIRVGRKKVPTEISSRVLQHGSLVVMPASFNDTHYHAILPDRSRRPRISINTKCLIPPRVYDCHAGQRYPASMPELNCLNPAIYVGCTVKSRRDGSIIREGSIYGNDHKPFDGHRSPIAQTENEFRAYAEKKMRDAAFREQALRELRGKHLLCWCKQDGPDRTLFCHARVWLELVNASKYAKVAAPPAPEPPTYKER